MSKLKIVDPATFIIEKTAWLFSQPSKAAIYGILNLINGKIYVGSAVNVNYRFNDHKSKLNRNKHSSKHLQGAWNEYGSFAFEFLILEHVLWKSDLLERETYWIELTDCCEPLHGYNKRKIPNSNLGLKLGPASDARKNKMSEIHTGRIISQEQREKIKQTLTGFKHTAKTKAKVSAASIGHIVTKEVRAKIGAANSKPEKWPHPNKYKCNCRECLDKKWAIRKGIYHEA